MDNTVVSALQAQLNHERQNAAIYEYVATTFDNMAYEGLGKFFRKQAEGELEHAKKFADFLISKRIQPQYDALESVRAIGSPVDLAKLAYIRETLTTGKLEAIYSMADEAGEYQVCALLDWFLVEQIEEEGWSYDLVTLVDGTDKALLLLIDKQYGDK